MKYTEEDLRNAYRTGFEFSRQYFTSGTSDELDEDDFISSLNPKEVEEDKISFTYSFLAKIIIDKQDLENQIFELKELIKEKKL